MNVVSRTSGEHRATPESRQLAQPNKHIYDTIIPKQNHNFNRNYKHDVISSSCVVSETHEYALDTYTNNMKEGHGSEILTTFCQKKKNTHLLVIFQVIIRINNKAIHT
jgi:hypothetical protein